MKENWVRTEIIQALRHGYNRDDEQMSIEHQADAVMALIERIAGDADTFHLLVGYLNNIRLDAMREDRRARENEEEIAERGENA